VRHPYTKTRRALVRLRAERPQLKRGPLGGWRTMNASFDGQPARLTLRSGRLLCIDPLALDGLRDQLTELAQVTPSEQQEVVLALGAQGLKVGLLDIPSFQPGTFELDVESFEGVDPGGADPSVFEVDSGAVVVIDVAALDAVARTLTWNRYDALLQTAPGDDSALEALNRDVGGPWFAILSADANSSFSGDGAFRLRHASVRRVP
jgi:hypothetical protein